MSAKDNESGLNMKQHQERIFGLYNPFHNSADGVDVGLYMVKLQVMAMGGATVYKSEAAKITGFAIVDLQKNK